MPHIVVSNPGSSALKTTSYTQLPSLMLTIPNSSPLLPVPRSITTLLINLEKASIQLEAETFGEVGELSDDDAARVSYSQLCKLVLNVCESIASGMSFKKSHYRSHFSCHSINSDLLLHFLDPLPDLIDANGTSQQYLLIQESCSQS